MIYRNGEKRRYNNMNKISLISVYTIQTKEKSVWSNQNIMFNFKNERLADEFIDRLNKRIGVNIEFEKLGFTEQNDTISLQTEITRTTREYVNYYTKWGQSFTREHDTIFV